jgi:hypothetical protein
MDLLALGSLCGIIWYRNRRGSSLPLAEAWTGHASNEDGEQGAPVGGRAFAAAFLEVADYCGLGGQVDFGAGCLGYKREDIGFGFFACFDGLPAGDDGVCVDNVPYDRHSQGYSPTVAGIGRRSLCGSANFIVPTEISSAIGLRQASVTTWTARFLNGNTETAMLTTLWRWVII